jgi:tetratricopeptide (TPR) repeat protein
MIAPQDSRLIGQRIAAKYRCPLESGDALVEKLTPVDGYTVERIEGERIWVTSGSGKGWFPISQVMLLDEAIEFYTREIEADSRNARAWSERGIIWIHKVAYARAVADLSEAIRLGPDEFSTYVWRGIAWWYEHEYDKSIADCNEAIRLQPQSVVAYRNRGIAWRAKQDHDKAIADFNEAIRLQPQSVVAYRNRGIAWRAKQEYDKAIADFNEAIRLDPQSPLNYLQRGCTWNAKNSHDKAIADYTEAIRLDPNDASTYHARGYYWLSKANHTEAIADLTDAIRLNPNNARYFSCRGWSWQSERDYDKALSDYDQAIRLDPTDSVAIKNRNWIRATFRKTKHRQSGSGSGQDPNGRRNAKIQISSRISRTLIGFQFRCWQSILGPVLGLVLCLILQWQWEQPRSYLLASIVVVAWCLRASASRIEYGQWRPIFWPWRLSRRVRGFSTAKTRRFSLLFPAGLDEAIDLEEFARWSELDLDDLSQRLGLQMKRPLTIVLVSSHRDLTNDFGRPMGGVALAHANAALLAADCPLREGLRHELTHLFSFQWNVLAPPLVQEGLAVWAQRITPDQTVAVEEMDRALSSGADPLQMLDRRYFFAPERMRMSYILAGAFTEFLICQFGWENYRRFYIKAYRRTFRRVFQRHFGVTVEEAWRRWHDESVASARQKPGLEQKPAC